MIDQALQFLREHLNGVLRAGSGGGASSADPDLVQFLAGDKVTEAIVFPASAVSLLLVGLEEETVLRPGDPFVRQLADGSHQRIRPDLRLNLLLLFVAQFSKYELSLKYLSRIIQYFQTHRSFLAENTPALNPRIEQLTLQMVPLRFGEQNELWGSLRTSYRPSVLYKVRMVTFRDEESAPVRAVDDLNLRITA